MQIQQIAKTSIITRGNTQGNSVSFSGRKARVSPNGMPRFEAQTPSGAINNQKTLLEEIGALLSDTLKVIKKSYEKSELKKIFVNPFEKRWNKFSQKSPKLAQAVKGAAWLTAGVGLYEIASAKFSKTDN